MREIDDLPYAGRCACVPVVLAFFLLFLRLAPAWAEPLRLNADSNTVSAAHYAKFARDKSGELSVLDMIDAAWLAPDQFNAAGFPFFGYTDDAIWLRLELENSGDEDMEALLELAVARLCCLTWFVLDGERIVKQVEDGMTGRTDNSVRTRYPVIALLLPTRETRTVYLRVQSDSTIWFQISVFATLGYVNHAARRDFLDYALIGLGCAMFLLASLNALVQRSMLYLLLSMLVVCFMFYHLVFNGYYQWIGGPLQGWVNRQLMLGMGLAVHWVFYKFTLVYICADSGGVQPGRAARWVSRLLGAGAVLLCVVPFGAGVWFTVALLLICFLTGIFTVINYARSAPVWYNLLFAGVWVFVLMIVFVMMAQLLGAAPVLIAPVNLQRVVLPLIYTVFFIVVAAQHYTQKQRHEQMQTAQQAAALAQLQALRYQLNPHFLFNTLTSIEALSRSAPDLIPGMVRRLARFLRLRMRPSRNGMALLKDELDSIKAYLDIEKIRFEERLRISLEIDDNVLSSLVPEMLLQPLVENAVKHGMQEGAIEIKVIARKNGGELVLQVVNGGQLAGRTFDGDGVGVNNLDDRLAHLYGSRARFDIREEDGRVIAEIRMPRMEGGSR